jgi:hypothetical protein
MTRESFAAFVGAATSVFLIAFVAFMCYLAMVVLPVGLYAQAMCLNEGFPRSHATITLSIYCETRDGWVVAR